MANKPTEQNVAKSWTCPKCGTLVDNPGDPPTCPKCNLILAKSNRGGFAVSGRNTA